MSEILRNSEIKTQQKSQQNRNCANKNIDIKNNPRWCCGLEIPNGF